MNRVLFLDRDGTINIDRGYIANAGVLELVPGAAEAIAQAKAQGYKIALITNQAGVAKGVITIEGLAGIHRFIEEQIALFTNGLGFHFDDIQFCPHHPDEQCACRKPKTLMLERAIKNLDADVTQSWYAGDHTKDMQAAQAMGIRSALVLTGHGHNSFAEIRKNAGLPGALKPTAVHPDLPSFIREILAL